MSLILFFLQAAKLSPKYQQPDKKGQFFLTLDRYLQISEKYTATIFVK